MSKLKYFDGTNWNVVNGQILGDTLPIGAIIPYGSETAPANWLVCDGSAVSRTTYAELFAVLGTKYGAGDGSTTFNLPNLKGRVPVGYDSTQTEFDTMGETGGEKQHTLTADEIPALTYRAKIASPEKGTGYFVGENIGYGTNNDVHQSSPVTINTNAGGQSHNILQPYQVVCYVIKAKQSAGLVANVSNEYSTSETDTYSCDYVNKISDYSTTEQIIGTWFGKPLYRKSFQKTGNLANISTGITDLDEVIDLKVNVKSSSGNQWRTVPWIYNAGTYDSTFAGGAYVNSTGSTIGFQAGSNLSATSKYNATILYTKTTN